MPPEFGSYEEEIRKFEGQFASNPESLVFARLADAYRKAGDEERALEVVSAGLDRHPNYLSAHVVKAKTLHGLGREREAAATFRQVLELDPQNLVALRSLADIARNAGDLDAAREWFRRLAQLDPQDPEVEEALAELDAGVEPGSSSGRPESTTGAEGDVEELMAVFDGEADSLVAPLPESPVTEETEAATAEALAGSEPEADSSPEAESAQAESSTTVSEWWAEPPEAEEGDGDDWFRSEFGVIGPEPEVPEEGVSEEPPPAASARPAGMHEEPSLGSPSWMESFEPESPGERVADPESEPPEAAEPEPPESAPTVELQEEAGTVSLASVEETDRAMGATSEDAGTAGEAVARAPVTLERGWWSDSDWWEPFGEGHVTPSMAAGIDPWEPAGSGGPAADEPVPATASRGTEEPPAGEAAGAEVVDVGTAPPELEESAPSGDDEGDDVLTETMAELYARQGLHDQAAEIYERLTQLRPEDEDLRRRRDALRRKQSEGRPAVRVSGAEKDTAESAAPEPAAAADSTGAESLAPGRTGAGRASIRQELLSLLGTDRAGE